MVVKASIISQTCPLLLLLLLLLLLEELLLLLLLFPIHDQYHHKIELQNVSLVRKQ